MKDSQPFLSLSDMDFVEHSRDIRLGELFSLSNLVQSFINQR